jgi:hypothetical protein
LRWAAASTRATLRHRLNSRPRQPRRKHNRQLRQRHNPQRHLLKHHPLQLNRPPPRPLQNRSPHRPNPSRSLGSPRVAQRTSRQLKRSPAQRLRRGQAQRNRLPQGSNPRQRNSSPHSRRAIELLSLGRPRQRHRLGRTPAQQARLLCRRSQSSTRPVALISFFRPLSAICAV